MDVSAPGTVSSDSGTYATKHEVGAHLLGHGLDHGLARGVKHSTLEITGNIGFGSNANMLLAA